MNKKQTMNENAISPVVGVMLMLVVTIIIAAVVSGFAGSLTSSAQKAPQLVMDVSIKNTGDWKTSFILFEIKSTSEPIPTRDLRIATSWRTKDGITGGNTTASGLNYPNVRYDTYIAHAPIGYGSGVTGVNRQRTSGDIPPAQFFGNYTLMVGTTMRNGPSSSYGGTTMGGGEIPYMYRSTHVSSGYIDSVQAVLGGNWNATRPGDVVDVSVTHLPSGQVIHSQSVVVQG